MKTIYEITGDYFRLMEMAEEEDLDPQALADTLESLDGEFEDKADGYAKILGQLAADAEVLKKEEKRLSDRRKVLENNTKRMKETLQKAMEAIERPKFKTKLFSFGIQKNPPSVVVDDVEAVGVDYWEYPEPVINKKKMLEDLKAGVEVSGAHIEQGQSLRIR